MESNREILSEYTTREIDKIVSIVSSISLEYLSKFIYTTNGIKMDIINSSSQYVLIEIIMNAIHCNRIDLIKYLVENIEYNINIRQTNVLNKILLLAVNNEIKLDIIELILQNGASPDIIKNIKGFSIELCELLVKYNRKLTNSEINYCTRWAHLLLQ